jgi:aminomethyltransferase
MKQTVRETLPIGTPFHTRTAALNQTTCWYGWNGYLIPDVYNDPATELQAVRNAVAAVDMSPLPKFEVSGKDASRLVDRLITRAASRLDVGQIFYTPLCNEAGKLIADGLVFRTAPDVYRFSLDNCYLWMQQQSSCLQVEISDITNAYGVLSLQGPLAGRVVEKATGASVEALTFSRLRQAQIAGRTVDLARQGFTGELGFEIWVRREDGAEVWDAVMAAGEACGIQPAGEYAIDIARVEAGLIVISADYTGAGPDPRCADLAVDYEHVATPFEVGLGRFVDFNKQDFVGKQALLEESQRGAARRLTGLELDWHELASQYIQIGLPPDISPRVRWDALQVQKDGEKIGRATSLTWSPTLNKMIGFGCLDDRFASQGSTVDVRWPLAGRFVDIPAVVTGLPFMKRRRSVPTS